MQHRPASPRTVPVEHESPCSLREQSEPVSWCKPELRAAGKAGATPVGARVALRAKGADSGASGRWLRPAALAAVRESPLCLLAARSAAACKRTRAVARVGGAATGADSAVAAGWDDRRERRQRGSRRPHPDWRCRRGAQGAGGMLACGARSRFAMAEQPPAVGDAAQPHLVRWGSDEPRGPDV
jgi:hypothetical protein